MLELKSSNYIDWNVKSVIKLLDRNNYAYRVILKFADGTQQVQQKSGFKTKREAEDARKRTMGELSNGTYVVKSNVKVKDYSSGEDEKNASKYMLVIKNKYIIFEPTEEMVKTIKMFAPRKVFTY